MLKVGNKIKKIREYKNYTQEYMAQSLGLSITAYGKIERDETEMTLTRLSQISKILTIDYRQILDFDEKNIFNVENGQNAAIGNNHTVYHNDRMIEHLQTEILYLRENNTQLLDIINSKTYK